MNKIYVVKWANLKLNAETNVGVVIVQGERLTQREAKRIAKKQVLKDLGKRYFKKNKLKFFDIFDVTDKKPVIESTYI